MTTASNETNRIAKTGCLELHSEILPANALPWPLDATAVAGLISSVGLKLFKRVFLRAQP